MGRGQESDSIIMTNTIENLILDLLEWIGRRERTYQETLDAWRTSCPRLPVWEDANDRCLVERVFVEAVLSCVLLQQGLPFLRKRGRLSSQNLRVRADQKLANLTFLLTQISPF